MSQGSSSVRGRQSIRRFHNDVHYITEPTDYLKKPWIACIPILGKILYGHSESEVIGKAWDEIDKTGG